MSWLAALTVALPGVELPSRGLASRGAKMRPTARGWGKSTGGRMVAGRNQTTEEGAPHASASLGKSGWCARPAEFSCALPTLSQSKGGLVQGRGRRRAVLALTWASFPSRHGSPGSPHSLRSHDPRMTNALDALEFSPIASVGDWRRRPLSSSSSCPKRRSRAGLRGSMPGQGRSPFRCRISREAMRVPCPGARANGAPSSFDRLRMRAKRLGMRAGAGNPRSRSARGTAGPRRCAGSRRPSSRSSGSRHGR